jgi:hypothetical protein
MPSKQELEALPLTGLAVLCKKVADNPEKYTEAGAAVAVKLRELWLLSEERFNPSLKEQQEGERKQAELKKRMAEFCHRRGTLCILASPHMVEIEPGPGAGPPPSVAVSGSDRQIRFQEWTTASVTTRRAVLRKRELATRVFAE